VRVEEIALKVVDALTAIEIPYMLVGSFSSNYYGIPRSTKDVDFVIELGAKRITDLRSYLQDDFSFDPQMAFETFTGTTKNVVQAKGKLGIRDSNPKPVQSTPLSSPHLDSLRANAIVVDRSAILTRILTTDT
jgi:hypothetical protein